MATVEFHRPVKLTTQNVEIIEVAYCDLTERISRPYCAELCVLVPPETSTEQIHGLVGTRATVEIFAQADSMTPIRHVHGVVTRAVLETRVAVHGEQSCGIAHLTIEPAVVLLRLERRGRVFQRRSAIDIVQEVLTGAALDCKISQAQPVLYDNRLLFNESHFDFASRLLELEGISYYFTHGSSEEKMVITDDPSGFAPADSMPILAHSSRTDSVEGHENWVDLHLAQGFVSKESVVVGFDWTKHKPLRRSHNAAGRFPTSESGIAPHYGIASLWDYDRGSASFGRDDAALVAARERDRAQVRTRTILGQSDLLQASAGAYVKLSVTSDLTNVDIENEEFLIVGVVHRISPLAGELAIDGRGSGTPSYFNELEILPRDVKYVPPIEHFAPIVPGLQTATVVAPEGTEIYTEDWGRVRVQFHWNSAPRNTQRPDDESCWLTMVQSWAGMRFGAQFVPRVGMEVAIAFMDGDIDRPIVIGCIPTATNKLPFNPVGKNAGDTKHVSGIRSHSLREGSEVGDDNEISFDDTADAEKLGVRARKDLDMDVLNTADLDFKAEDLDSKDLDASPVVHAKVKKGDFVATVERDSKTAIGRYRELVVGNEETNDGCHKREIWGTDETIIHQKRTQAFKGEVETTIDGELDATVEQRVKHTWKKDAEQTVAGKLTVKTKELDAESSLKAVLKGAGSSLLMDAKGVTAEHGRSTVKLTPVVASVEGPKAKVAADAEVRVNAPLIFLN